MKFQQNILKSSINMIMHEAGININKVLLLNYLIVQSPQLFMIQHHVNKKSFSIFLTSPLRPLRIVSIYWGIRAFRALISFFSRAISKWSSKSHDLGVWSSGKVLIVSIGNWLKVFIVLITSRLRETGKLSVNFRSKLIPNCLILGFEVHGNFL